MQEEWFRFVCESVHRSWVSLELEFVMCVVALNVDVLCGCEVVERIC